MIKYLGSTIKLLMLFLLINFNFAPKVLGSSKKILIDIHNIDAEKGNLHIAIFSKSSTFPSENSLALDNYTLAVLEDTYELRIPIQADINWNEVAIAVFLDTDFNNKLTKNILGIPIEAFGFSRNPSIIRGAPTFDDCRISIKNTHKVKIYLRKIF